jgi:hypothetical protein
MSPPDDGGLSPEEFLRRAGAREHRAGDARHGGNGHAGGGDASWTLHRPSAWTAPAPPRAWVVDDWIPRGVVTGLYADGGTGKSMLTQQLCTSAAASLPWIGLPTRPGRALALFCEDDADEVHRRQDRINAALGIKPADLGDRVAYLARLGEDNTLMTFDGRGAVGRATPGFDRLMETCAAFKPDVLVLDTAADVFGGDEVQRAQVRFFVQHGLGRLARATGAGVVLCAHPSVAGMSNGTGSSGSTAWANTMRSRLFMERPKASSGLPTEARILTRAKANFAPDGSGRTELIWRRGVLAPMADAERAALAPSWETILAVFDLIEARWAVGRPFSNAPQTRASGRYLPDVIEATFAVPAATAADLVRSWLANGCLETAEADPKRKLWGLRVIRRPDR